jgi:hypothetical protein
MAGDKFVCTASEWLKEDGYDIDVDNVDPEREIEFCHLKEGVTPGAGL